MVSSEERADRTHRIKEYIIHGPEADSGATFPEFVLSMVLWARFWAFMLVITAGIVVAAYVWGPLSLWPYALGLIIGTWATGVIDT